RFGDTNQELINGTLHLASTPESVLYSAIRAQVFRGGYWQIGKIRADQGLEIQGSAIRPANWFGGVRFTVNGRPFPTVELGPGNPDVAAEIGVEDERSFSFRCHAPVGTLDAADGYEFAFTDGSLRPFDENQIYHHVPIDQPIPGEEL